MTGDKIACPTQSSFSHPFENTFRHAIDHLTFQRAELPAAYARAALDATRIMGLGVAGVDLLESKDGPRVIEVNSSPGLRGVERATGIDVAQRIIAHAERLVQRRRTR